MRPIPVSFQVGPLTFHTYGFGLAIAFYVAWRYLVARFSRAGYTTDWLVSLGIWVVASAIVGARVLHVVTNLSAYTADPSQVLAVWHGGLSSFGGLIFAVPTALWIAHRRCPDLGVLRGLDLAMPALAAGWSLGRILGPQLMYQGGGHRTTQWFGMYYAGQAGRRIPVPIIQCIEDGLLLVVLIVVERRLMRASTDRASLGSTPPPGALTAIAMVIWGITRGLDQRFWLGEQGIGSLLVQWASVALIVAGLVLGLRVWRRWRDYLDAASERAVPDATRLIGQ